MGVFMNTTDGIDSTSATLTDTGLVAICKSGYLYTARFTGMFQSAALTTGVGIAFDLPNSPTDFAATGEAGTSTTVSSTGKDIESTVTDAEQMTFTAIPATTGGIVQVVGMFTPSVSGEMKVQFNTEVNGSAVTYKGGLLEIFEHGIAAG